MKRDVWWICLRSHCIFITMNLVANVRLVGKAQDGQKKIVQGIMEGRGRLQDIDLLERISNNMQGRTICALSDAAAMPTIGFITKFRDEFEFFIKEGRSKVIK